MKNIFTLLVLGLSSPLAFAGSMDLNCTAYRVSQDSNKNVQVFTSDRDGASINGSAKLEILSGDLLQLDKGSPAKAVLKSPDAKSDINVVISVLSNLASIDGHENIGRDHNVDIYKVAIKASRDGKTHSFTGTCTAEVVSSCGGGCQPENPKRDEL